LDVADPTKPIQKKASVTYNGNVERDYTYRDTVTEKKIVLDTR